jgi:uncharacterized protein YoxC
LIPFVEPLSHILGSLSILVGGVFGISVIMLVLKVKEYFDNKKSLKALHSEMSHIRHNIEALTGEVRRLKELNMSRKVR